MGSAGVLLLQSALKRITTLVPLAVALVLPRPPPPYPPPRRGRGGGDAGEPRNPVVPWGGLLNQVRKSRGTRSPAPPTEADTLLGLVCR